MHLADSLGCPTVDDIDPTGECCGNWVLRGPGIDWLAVDLTDLEAVGDMELQDGERNYTPFLIELSIGQATRKETIEEVADRLCAMKDLSLTRSAAALLAAVTDSGFQTAEALAGLATARDFERDISLDEVRFALSTLDPEALLPTLDTDGDDAERKTARSKIVHTLLTAREPLTTGELAERAGISKQSIRNHRDDIEAFGLLAIDDRGVGKASITGSHSRSVTNAAIRMRRDRCSCPMARAKSRCPRSRMSFTSCSKRAISSRRRMPITPSPTDSWGGHRI